MERDHVEDLDLYGRIIFRNSLEVWTAFVWPKIWTESFCKRGNEPSISIKCEKILD
jgi:hypothetical protein